MEEQKGKEVSEVLLREFEHSVARWEADTGKVFPDTERELFNDIIIDRYKNASDDQGKWGILLRAFILTNGILLGFLPSEYWASCERVWTAFRSNVPPYMSDNEERILFNEANQDRGEVNFWLGIAALSEDLDWDDCRNYLDRALEDRLLPRKMIIASLLLRAWCKVHLKEYDNAVEDLEILTEEVKLRTSDGKQRVEHIWGYIEALAKFDIDIEESGRLVAILPDDEADEIALEGGKQTPVTGEELFKRVDMLEMAIIKRYG